MSWRDPLHCTRQNGVRNTLWLARAKNTLDRMQVVITSLFFLLKIYPTKMEATRWVKYFIALLYWDQWCTNSSYLLDGFGQQVSSPLLPPNDPRASFLSYYLRRAQELLLEILKELCSPPSAAAVCHMLFSTLVVVLLRCHYRRWAVQLKTNCYYHRVML